MDQGAGNQEEDAEMYDPVKRVADEKGTGYEYKIALLVFLRAFRLTEKFKLSVNVPEAGSFDDIGLTYTHDGKEYRLFVQAKHKQKRGVVIKESALKGNEGKFSLYKLFTSVEANLKDKDLSDCTNYVLYTNGSLEVQLSSGNGLNPFTTELLSTGGNLGTVYSVKKTDDLSASIRHKSGGAVFLSKLAIFGSQAHVDEVSDLIKQEIALQFHRIIPNTDSICDTLLEGVKAWWEVTERKIYLTENWSIWRNFAPDSALLNHIRFKNEEIEACQKKIDKSKVHIEFYSVDVQLRTLKVLQALQGKEKESYFIIKVEDLLNTVDDTIPLEEKSVIRMWLDGKIDSLVVDTCKSSDHNASISQVLQKLINLPNESRRLLIISDGKLKTRFDENWVHESDTCTLNQLDELSKEKVMERLWERSPKKTQVLSNDATGELLSMFLTVENGSTSLLADVNGDTPLMHAIMRQDLKMVELLLELGSSIKAVDQFGDSLLIMACRHSSQEIVKILLDYGVETAVADYHGNSPLIIAVRNGYVEIVKLLLGANASTKAADKFGFTSLQLAAIAGNSEIIGLLLQHGADTRPADVEGNTALYHAVGSKSRESVRLLLEKGARTMAGNLDGDTPLFLAVRNGLSEIVRLLLMHKASVAAATAEGDTCLHIAVKKRYRALVKLLIEFGAPTSVRDSRGETPLEIAQREKFGDLVRILRNHVPGIENES